MNHTRPDLSSHERQAERTCSMILRVVANCGEAGIALGSLGQVLAHAGIDRDEAYLWDRFQELIGAGLIELTISSEAMMLRAVSQRTAR